MAILAALPLALTVGCSPAVTTGAPSPQTVAVTDTKTNTTPAPRFTCKVLDANGLRYDVTTSGGTYDGRITVLFQDYANSGHTFPPTHVTGATEHANWQPVPAEDIGASARPTTCTAAAG